MRQTAKSEAIATTTATKALANAVRTSDVKRRHDDVNLTQATEMKTLF